MEIAGVRHFPRADLKMLIQYLLISLLCGDCKWAVMSSLQYFRVHLVEAAFSNCSLLRLFWYPYSSSSARNTVYWAEWEGRTATIHTGEEARTLRQVLSSLPSNFHETQYNALELRQHFYGVPSNSIGNLSRQKSRETVSQPDGSPCASCLTWPLSTKKQTQAIHV